jgi:hypothetical protein
VADEHIWNAPGSGLTRDDEERLVGYDVEAADGGIGTVDGATFETGRGHVVVATGPWIFGRKVLLPAGVIDRVDHEARCVHVTRTKDEIRHAPEYDPDTPADDPAEARVGAYYAPFLQRTAGDPTPGPGTRPGL